MLAVLRPACVPARGLSPVECGLACLAACRADDEDFNVDEDMEEEEEEGGGVWLGCRRPHPHCLWLLAAPQLHLCNPPPPGSPAGEEEDDEEPEYQDDSEDEDDDEEEDLVRRAAS